MGQYLEEIKRSMDYLAQNPKTVFLGQSIKYAGNVIYKTLENVSRDRLIEMPVAEELQMGISTGLALQGWIPVTTYPRFDFLLLAFNQLVNHLDKMTLISHGKMNPKVIVKVMAGSTRPLDPGWQHKQNYVQELKTMCKTIEVIELLEPNQIFEAHKKALERTDRCSTVLVEYGDFLTEK